MRAREVLQFRESVDPKISGPGVAVKTGRKWRAEGGLHFLVGTVARGRAGLGSIAFPQFDKARGKERRELVQNEVRAVVEEERSSRAVGMKQQGAWTKWEQVAERKISWADIWRAEPLRIKFSIQTVYDVLPSPSNLHCWGTPECPLCQRKGTLEHVMSCCPKALGDGRYRWRHDHVLKKTIAESICTGIDRG